MYFKESEPIANEGTYPRSEIKKVDRFLARRNVSQFKLHDVNNLTDIQDNVQRIVDEYVRAHVLKVKRRYFCPEHEEVVLKLTRSIVITQKGYCHRCNKTHSLKGLDVETIYQRIKEPLRWSDSRNTTVANHVETPEQPLLGDKKWIIERVIQIVIGAAIIVGVIFNIFSQRPEKQDSRQILGFQTVTATHSSSTTQNEIPTVTGVKTLKIPPNAENTLFSTP